LRRDGVPDSSDAHGVFGSVQWIEVGGSEGVFEPLINTNWALIFSGRAGNQRFASIVARQYQRISRWPTV
ncbi:MAG: hypothetical protein ABI273_18695, partial [Lacunisphaera sp.]